MTSPINGISKGTNQRTENTQNQSQDVQSTKKKDKQKKTTEKVQIQPSDSVELSTSSSSQEVKKKSGLKSKIKEKLKKVFHKSTPEEKLEKKLQKREKEYTKTHNQLVDKIDLRNKAQGKLTTKAVNVGTTNDSVQRVGLSVTQTNDSLGELIDTTLVENGISPSLGKGLMEGFTSGKAKQKDLTPEEYLEPTGRNYVETGTKSLGMTGDVMKTAYRQSKVNKAVLKFGKAKEKLRDTRMLDMVAKQGDLKKQKHGHLVSGSLQVGTVEELEKVLNELNPVSNVSQIDIPLQTPSLKSLLPPEAPAKLPEPSKKVKVKRSEKHLTPQEKVEKELATRDGRIAKLDEKLRKEDPVELKNTIHERDTYQVRTVGDVVKGAINAPMETVTVGAGYLLNMLPDWSWKPVISQQTVQEAEQTLGQSVGNQLSNGNGETMIRTQAKVENLHAKGKPTAKELLELQKEKVMEEELNMTVDEEGDKFYDMFETSEERDTAFERFKQKALERLPRTDDQLYLNEEVTHLVPGVWEGLRRAYNAWFNPPNS